MAVFSHLSLTLKQHKNHGIAVFLDVVTSIFGTYPYQLVGPLVIFLDFHCVFQISIGLFGWVLPFLYVDDSIFLTFLPQPMTQQKKLAWFSRWALCSIIIVEKGQRIRSCFFQHTVNINRQIDKSKSSIFKKQNLMNQRASLEFHAPAIIVGDEISTMRFQLIIIQWIIIGDTISTMRFQLIVN